MISGFRLALAAVLAMGLAGCGDGGDGGDGSAGEGGAGDYEVPRVAYSDLSPCGELPIPSGWRCGSIEVPTERRDHSLGETEIGFAVRPRDEQDRPSAGAIFAVEGGPGYSSTGSATTYTKLFGDLLRHRELVLVDMRGTGRSDALDCPDLQAGRAPEWIALSECARRLGPRAETFRTAAAADDLDDVRRALGLETITLYGDSYGTFLAQSYAFRHPDRLRALVLDSAYPARGESAWYPSLPRTGIRAISIACRRSEECSGDARRRLEKLVRYLRRTGRGVGPLIDAIAEAGNDALDAPGAYLAIDRAGVKLRHGNPGPWSRLTRQAKPRYAHVRFYARAGELVVGCNDYPMIWDPDAPEPERRAQLERAIREYDPDAFAPFTPREIALSSELGYLECLTWPAPRLPREPAVAEDAEPTDAPVLVVNGELDDITTPYEGRLVADEFPDSRLYIARNAGHVLPLWDSHSKPAKRIRRFLRNQNG